MGDRGEATCRRLWDRVPPGYRRGACYTDFWRAYALVVPEGQHVAAGKEAGQTNHVERLNGTLRQRLARFVRGTLSFSKKRQMHKVCLYLFLHGYNTDIQARWLRQASNAM